MNKLTEFNREGEEERLPLWLLILLGVVVVGPVAILLVQFFSTSSP